MRHLILSLLLSLVLVPVARGFEIEEQSRFGPGETTNVLRVLSTADLAFIRPMLLPFLSKYPDVAVEYTVASSSEVMKAVFDESQSYDLVISSAMDLQTKLANDGLALSYTSQATQSLPDWANWGDQIFAFTQEPAAMVLSNKAFEGLELPRTRQELLSVLRQYPNLFDGKVGTYDVRQSGLGYLFATQDARTSETYWRLSEVMGLLNVRLYTSSATMIDAVVTGELAIAYNVLGSYAMNRADKTAFTIVLPSDFTTVMLRTALIPVTAKRTDLAGRFIDHLIERTNEAGPSLLQLGSADDQVDENSLRRIRLGPGLLVYLDKFKNRSFVNEWESAILQE